jgi:phage-related protein
VFVLHAFEKTTNGVDHKEMAAAAKRYKEMRKTVDAERRRVKASTAKRGK